MGVNKNRTIEEINNEFSGAKEGDVNMMQQDGMLKTGSAADDDTKAGLD